MILEALGSLCMCSIPLRGQFGGLGTRKINQFLIAARIGGDHHSHHHDKQYCISKHLSTQERKGGASLWTSLPTLQQANTLHP